MHKMEANEIVGTTFYTIHKITAQKNWESALCLYFAYIEQSRIQESNRTRSLDKFMMKKLWRGNTKLLNAKKVLKNLWLIDQIQVRDKDWKIQTVYVKTNYIIDEQKVRQNNIIHEIQVSPPQPSKRVYGEQETNALSIKDKCLKNKRDITSSSTMTTLRVSFWLSLDQIDERFLHKKTLDTILTDCEAIKDISFYLRIRPVYNKQTINAVDIMLNDKTRLEIAERCIDNWREGDDFDELIRQDYYLPEMVKM